MKKRTFLFGTLGATAAAASGALYTFKIEPTWVEYVQRDLPIKNLPLHLHGKTLVQISDLHVGLECNPDFLSRTFEQVASLDPTLVVYTGDFITYKSRDQFTQLQQVMKNSPRGQLGSYAILGNHDYGFYWKMPEVADEIMEILSNRGIQTLRNESIDADGLNICGLDDFWATNFAPEPALSQLEAGNANLVLSHNPDTVDLDIWHGYEGWILSGHTHGGQIKPPFLPPPVLSVKNKRYTAGAFDLGDGRNLYINRALGNRKPVRFNVRPEITLFRMQSV